MARGARNLVSTQVGGQDLVASTLKSFENLIRMREREEVQELREICRPKTPPDPEVWPRSTPTLDERVLCVFQGMDFDGEWLYIAERERIGRIRFDHNAGATVDHYEDVVTGLTGDGNHWSKTIRFGPDGMLYLAQGST